MNLQEYSAQNNEQMASAWKNIGVTYNKMILKEPETLVKGSYYLKALESLGKALFYGNKIKSTKWQDYVDDLPPKSLTREPRRR